MYANFLLIVVCYAHSNYPYLILYYISNILIMLYDDMSAEAYRSIYYNIINNAVQSGFTTYEKGIVFNVENPIINIQINTHIEVRTNKRIMHV